ncbi:hypothetical protein DH2020_024231 [Rehmannia glutinosa]|uniref:Kinesin-like protein n=1 Tax=Rehmannia glutinosa TaxID=99300 RepID=A0ABR0WAJ8_REHGL
MAEGVLQFDLASMVEDVLQQQGKRLSDIDLASRKAQEASLRRYDAAGWLRKMAGVVAGKDLPAEPSEEDFRLGLRSGIILCNVLNKVQPGAVPKVIEAPPDTVIIPDGAALSAYQYFENVRNFLVAIEEMGIPTFEASDLEQGGKSSRIVNCILALKSYNEWKQCGGNGLWKFSGNSKPPSSGKQIVRKNSDLFLNFIARNSSPGEKSLDGLSSEENTCGDEVGTSHSLHVLVRELLSDKSREDIPVIVENMLSKVMEEIERRLASQNEQIQTTSRDEDVPSSDKTEEIEVRIHCLILTFELLHLKCTHSLNWGNICCLLYKTAIVTKDESLPEKDFHTKDESLPEKDFHTKDECLPEKDFQHSASKAHFLKHQEFVDNQKRSVQVLKNMLHSAKEEMQLLQMKHQEEVSNLGKHLNTLAHAASGYQKVLEENRKLYNQVQDLKGNIRVYCRVRPFLPGQPNGLSTVEDVSDSNITIITPPKFGKGKKTFTFNKAFGPSSSQEEVFADTQPLIRSVLDGYNVCIFAYGQTGSGKTFTMNRAVGSTAMNDRSSRSHSCLTVHVQGRDLTSGAILRGCMHLVDLAGSERVDKTEATGDRLKEAQHINRSLSALGDVISSLSQKNAHVPYRNSKLTQLLQDSLGGRAKTLMFVHISPEPDALGETISTLKFAERVSTVELGAARTNKDTTDVKELKEQIATLKAALARKDGGESGALQLSRYSSPDRLRVMSSGSSPSRSSWNSIDDACKTEGQSNSSSTSRRHSLDPQDLLMNSPPWPPLGSSPGLMEEEKCAEMFYQKSVIHDSSKVYPEQSLNKISGRRRHSLDNGLARTQYETITTDDSDDLEIATSDSSEADYQLQLNIRKSNSMPNVVGSKVRRIPSPKPTKGQEMRSLIPQPTKRASNGIHSPLLKNGRQPVAAVGRRKPANGK